MPLVKFCFETSRERALNSSDYVENICKNLFTLGLVTNYIFGINNEVVSRPIDSIFNVEDDIWVCKFIYTRAQQDYLFQLTFMFETYKKSEHLTVEIYSPNYMPNPKDNYLEQLKINIKNFIKKDWDSIVWLMD